MRRTVYIASELLIACLLAILLSLALSFQPVWLRAVAALIMLVAFVGIFVWATSAPLRAQLLVFLSPVSYVAYFAALTVSERMFLTPRALVTEGIYILGVALLGVHLYINAWVRRPNEFGTVVTN